MDNGKSEDSTKPVVEYHEVDDLEVGRQAYIRQGKRLSKTSEVTSIHPSGVFETAFRRYVPADTNPNVRNSS